MGSQPPTVLFVAVPAAIGGSNRALLTLLGPLGARLTRVVAAPKDGALAREAEQGHLAEGWVGTPRPRWGRVGRVAGALRIALWVIRRRHLLTIIHANTTTGFYLAAPAAVLAGVPLVVWVHDPVSTRWGRRIGPLLRRMVKHVQWVAVSPTAARVVVTNGMCSTEDVAIVPNPIDPDQVVGRRSETDKGGRLTVGYLSGGTHRKGFDLLPRVMELVADLPLEWRLFLTRRPSPFGTPVWDRLDAMEGAAFTVPGRKPDVREVYGQCDIIFLPSREESFSLITAEAMLNGLPVVATDLEPTRALLGDEAAGLLFALDDVGQAANALRRLVLEPSLRVRLGEEGRNRAAQFVPMAIADRMLGLYGIDGGSSGTSMSPGVRHR